MKNEFLILLITGNSDMGTKATMAFSCALSSLSLELNTSVFLAGDGSIWGFKGSANGVAVPGHPTLDTLVREFTDNGGKILLCSACYNRCKLENSESEKVLAEGVRLAGFTEAVTIAQSGGSLTF